MRLHRSIDGGSVILVGQRRHLLVGKLLLCPGERIPSLYRVDDHGVPSDLGIKAAEARRAEQLLCFLQIQPEGDRQLQDRIARRFALAAEQKIAIAEAEADVGVFQRRSNRHVSLPTQVRNVRGKEGNLQFSLVSGEIILDVVSVEKLMDQFFGRFRFKIIGNMH